MNLAIFAILVAITPHSFAGNVGWGSWTPCSVSCGNGTKTRTAVCRTGGQSCKLNTNPADGDNQTTECTPDCQTSAPPTQQVQNATTKGDSTQPDTTQGITTKTHQQDTPTQQNAPSTQQDTQTPVEPKEEKSTAFEGTMKMKKTFKKELEDKKSKEFQELAGEVKTAIEETFKNEDIDATVEIDKFTEGSIVLHYRVKSRTSVSSTKLHGAFSSSMKSGPMSSLHISTFSIAKSQNELPEGTLDQNAAPANSEKIVKPYLYFLYGFGGMVGLVIVFIVLAVTKRKVKPTAQVEEVNDYESYFNTPLSTKKMPNNESPAQSIQQVYDNPSMDDAHATATKAW